MAILLSPSLQQRQDNKHGFKIMPKASIISIGDEILIGQIINTNAQWIAHKLTTYGIIVDKQISISDKQSTIYETIRNEMDRCDIVITTGGLGPTSDDVTKEVICQVFSDFLYFDEPSYDNIKRLFEIRKRQITDRNKLQAMVPSRSIALKNDYGTAPGILYTEQNKLFLALPGVPIEMKSIFENSFEPYLIKYLAEHKGEYVLYRTLNTVQIFESNLADLIGNTTEILDKDTTLAFLPNYRGVRLRIGATKPSYEDAKKAVDNLVDKIKAKVGNYIISEDEFNLAKIAFELLGKSDKTLAIAESCTGGYLGKELTDLPGISKCFMGGVIAYSNQSKVNILNVKQETIDKYGAVSPENAREMAQKVRGLFATDFGISITGIAGPTGETPTKPVGTVYIGISDKDETTAFEYNLGENRSINRERAVANALLLLINKLNKG